MEEITISLIKNLNIKDGSATLTHLAVNSLFKSFNYFPNDPEIYILSGGGRLNKYLVQLIINKIGKSKIFLSEDYNWDGDFIEAYAFGYISIRKLLNLPITFPKTTGVKKSLTGGQIFI